MQKRNPSSKRRYILRHFLIALALFATFAVAVGVFLAPPAADPVAPGPPVHATPVELVRVVDGDTIVVRTIDGREERVRYIGIDAPEYDSRTGEGQAFGKEARDANEALLKGRPITLALDREHRDRFGRLLAYVYAGDEFVNAALLREGYAYVLAIPPNDRHWDLFLQLQAEALQNGRGLWGAARERIVDWRRAEDALDSPATVEGVVVRTHKDRDSGITFLNFSANIREDFVAIISETYGERFPKPPESNYSSRRVRVVGFVEAFEGQPQIAVQIPEQIEVLE